MNDILSKTFELYHQYQRQKKTHSYYYQHAKISYSTWNPENSTYLFPDLLESIKKNVKCQHHINYEFDNKKIKFNWWCKNKNISEFGKVIDIVNQSIWILSKFARKSINNISITIIDCDDKKKFASTDLPLTSCNVNSGYTIRHTNCVKIVVYRKEERTKTILHETIHALGLDCKHINKIYEQFWNNTFGIKDSTVNINECYTDSLAIYFNVIFWSLKKSNRHFDQFIQNVKLGMELERTHIIYTANLLLQHYSYRFIQDKIQYSHKHKELTHVIAYFILKAFIYSDLQEFYLYLDQYTNSRQDQQRFFSMLRRGKCIFRDNLYISGLKCKKVNSLRMSFTKHI